MKPIKIVTFTPVWQRQEIFEICLAGIERLVNYKPSKYKIIPFFMVSESCAAMQLLKKGYHFIFVQNQPLGNKKNEGLSYVMENFKFDYLLEIGSDDLITNDYLDLVEPYLKERTQQLCASKLYFFDIQTCEATYFETQKIFGLGRFIHINAIKEVLAVEPLWPPEAKRGMDTYSWRTLTKYGISLTKVEVNEPSLIDIKSSNNLNNMSTFTPCDMTNNELLSYFPEKEKIKKLLK